MQRFNFMTVIGLAMALPVCGCDQPAAIGEQPATAEQPSSRSTQANDGCASPYYYDFFGAAGGGKIYCSALREPCVSQDGKAGDACA